MNIPKKNSAVVSRIKKILRSLFIFFFVLLITINLAIVLSGKFYLYKGVTSTYLIGKSGPDIYDLEVFPYSTIENTPDNFKWTEDYQVELSQKQREELTNIQTTSLLIARNDTLLFEEYWGEHSEETVSNLFSASKSIVGLLIGIALDEGKIKSLDDNITDYIDFYNPKDSINVTIKDVLWMASDIDWSESGGNPFSDNAEAYYGTDLKKLMARQRFLGNPGEKFEYKSGNTQLLAFILEKSTGKSISELAEEKIWSKIGAEHEAYWSKDSEEGIEKAYCCFYGISRDYLRLGKLINQSGNWNGQQLISKGFMEQFSTTAPISDGTQENRRYAMHVWTYHSEAYEVIYCRGILGQYIISIPEKNLVIVRTGHKRGNNIESDGTLKESDFKDKFGHPEDLFIYLSIANSIIAKN